MFITPTVPGETNEKFETVKETTNKDLTTGLEFKAPAGDRIVSVGPPRANAAGAVDKTAPSMKANRLAETNTLDLPVYFHQIF